jgi:hypothetical protein
MKEMYLMGEPWLFGEQGREEYYAPAGQGHLCQQVLVETQDLDVVKQKLREEYLAIVWSLVQMGVNFRIIYSHPEKIDQKILAACIKSLGCRLAGFTPDYFPPGVVFPRDFATVLPGLILINSQMARATVNQKDGWRILSSPYGEGGRMLFWNKTTLVCERIILKDRGQGSERPGKKLEKIKQNGITVGLFPLPVAQALSRTGSTDDRFFFNDHLDRVACLIRGLDGSVHLVVDPEIITACWRGRKFTPCWIPRSPKDSIEKIKRVCERSGIEVHCPEKLEVPYSLNLVQFPDGRVLMTGGDASVAEIISQIVGPENIFKTPAPIRFFPVWVYGGIRCLVSEAPMPLFKSI